MELKVAGLQSQAMDAVAMNKRLRKVRKSILKVRSSLVGMTRKDGTQTDLIPTRDLGMRRTDASCLTWPTINAGKLHKACSQAPSEELIGIEGAAQQCLPTQSRWALRFQYGTPQTTRIANITRAGDKSRGNQVILASYVVLCSRCLLVEVSVIPRTPRLSSGICFCPAEELGFNLQVRPNDLQVGRSALRHGPARCPPPSRVEDKWFSKL